MTSVFLAWQPGESHLLRQTWGGLEHAKKLRIMFESFGLRCLVDTQIEMFVGNQIYKYEAQGSGQRQNKNWGLYRNWEIEDDYNI